MSSVLRRIEKNCSSFRKSDSVPSSISELNAVDLQVKTPEKCLSPLNYKWKSVSTVAKVRRNKSVSNVHNGDSNEKILNIREQYLEFDRGTSKFTKKYIKMKLAKLFRSSSKINSQSKEQDLRFQETRDHTGCTKSQSDIPVDTWKAEELSNDALRNLSFTAAMMTKSSQLLRQHVTDQGSVDHAKQIPSSTLRFWRKPSEEKVKASQRRTQDNIHGSNEVLMRINPSMDNNKHPSELSLFYDEGIFQQDALKISNSDIRNSVLVAGYDKALHRYQNIVNQSRHVSRRDKTLSLAYETEVNGGNHRLEMKTSQSSNNMSSLTRCHSVVQCLNPDVKRSFTGDVCTSPKFRGKCLNREPISQSSLKTMATNVNNCSINLAQVPPPPYDSSFLNKRFTKMKMSSTKPVSSFYDSESFFRPKQQVLISNQKPPTPPPRSDSLLRSFELICKHLTTSISEPRGDSFKIFKSQRDYENWLKNLPYNNPEKIAALLKMRSRIARRQCVSELIDIHVVNMDCDGRRRHSWPSLTNPSTTFDSDSSRRASSLSRVKIKKEAKIAVKSVDSPSLHNYSRLYSLRHAQISQPQPTVVAPVAVVSRRSYKHRYRLTSSLEPAMTESCHETSTYTVI